jgi:hypothetical protein
VEVIPAHSVLPAVAELPLSFPAGAATGSLFLLLGGHSAADAVTPVGEVVVASATAEEPVASLMLVLVVTAEEGIKAEVVDVATRNVVSSLVVPF